MGTRSRIGYVDLKTKEVFSVYCHWDGYPEHNGEILNQHYSTFDKIKELVSFGNMSSLAKNIHPPKDKEHNFDKSLDDVCVFYHRDRGEELSIRKFRDEKEFIRKAFNAGEEYAYLFVTGKWIIYQDTSYIEAQIEAITSRLGR